MYAAFSACSNNAAVLRVSCIFQVCSCKQRQQYNSAALLQAFHLCMFVIIIVENCPFFLSIYETHDLWVYCWFIFRVSTSFSHYYWFLSLYWGFFTRCCIFLLVLLPFHQVLFLAFFICCFLLEAAVTNRTGALDKAQCRSSTSQMIKISLKQQTKTFVLFGCHSNIINSMQWRCTGDVQKWWIKCIIKSSSISWCFECYWSNILCDFSLCWCSPI